MDVFKVESATTRAARGAALLDVRRPGWYKRADIHTLDIYSSACCALAQEYGERGYVRGRQELGFDTHHADDVIAHGFAPEVVDPEHDPGGRLDANELNVGWVTEITSRRGRDETFAIDSAREAAARKELVDA